MLYVVYPNLLTRKIVGVYFFCFVLFIPVLILIFVYGRIAWVLARKVDEDLTDKGRREQIENKAVDKATNVRKRNYELAKRNVIKTLTLVAACFVICWTGNQVWVLAFNFEVELDWDSIGYQFFILMICVNCVINPFIYLIQYKEYQKALKALFCGRKKVKSTSETQISKSSVSALDITE